MLAKLTIGLIILLRVSSLKFSITRDLTSIDELDTAFWSNVEVEGTCLPESDITVEVKIPKTLIDTYLTISVFFANDVKNILQIDLNTKIKGTFYKTSYHVLKTFEGSDTTKEMTSNFVKVSGVFPSYWLPETCNKISAAVLEKDGKYYNYYGIQNYGISISDLMVVEEYKKFTCKTNLPEKYEHV